MLYWLQARDGEGTPVGQHEFQQFNEQHIEKGKVMKIASGLEMATGARVERDAPENNIYIYINLRGQVPPSHCVYGGDILM